jgi:cytochrome P450
MEQQIREILTGHNVDVKEVSHKTVFMEILDSKIPAAHATEIRLQNEAVSVIGAGFETTRWALTVASYHILANAHVLDRLRAELEEAIPDAEKIPEWSQLSQLPYLTACIEEGE